MTSFENGNKGLLKDYKGIFFKHLFNYEKMFNKKQSFALACAVIGTHKNIIKDAVAITHSHVTGTTCVFTRRGRQRNCLRRVCAFYDMKHISLEKICSIMSTLSVTLTLFVQLKHIPPLPLILSISDFPVASSSSLLPF